MKFERQYVFILQDTTNIAIFAKKMISSWLYDKFYIFYKSD